MDSYELKSNSANFYFVKSKKGLYIYTKDYNIQTQVCVE